MRQDDPCHDLGDAHHEEAIRCARGARSCHDGRGQFVAARFLPPLHLTRCCRCPRRPGPKDYLNAALITLGCTLFLMTGSVKSRHASADSSMFGLMLMLGYLGFDGFTSTFQDKLFKVGGGRLVVYESRLWVGMDAGPGAARCGQAPAAPAWLAAASMLRTSARQLLNKLLLKVCASQRCA